MIGGLKRSMMAVEKYLTKSLESRKGITRTVQSTSGFNINPVLNLSRVLGSHFLIPRHKL